MKETKTGAKSFFLQKPEENKRNDTAQEREIERERVKWQRDQRHVLKALLFLIHAHNTERERHPVQSRNIIELKKTVSGESFTIETFFSSPLTSQTNRLECFSLARSFQLSLMFGSKAGAYPQTLE